VNAGKPHPRWADSNFRDGDPSEKWHSRAAKSAPNKRRSSPEPGDHRGGNPTLAPIKTEPMTETPQPHLYRFSPSPESSVRYNTFRSDIPSPTATSFGTHGHRHTYSEGSSGGSSTMSYQSPPSAPSMTYNGGHRHSGDSSFSDGEYQDDDRTYDGHYSPDRSPIQSFCPCRTNPATNHTYVALSNQLQNTLSGLRPFFQHPTNSPCTTYRRVVELNSILLYVLSPFLSLYLGAYSIYFRHNASDQGGSNPGTSYDTLPTPTDSDIMTPLSASSTPYHGPATHSGHSPHEWNTITGAGYSSYFPMQPGEHVYNNGIP
jgi:hypothetical protein